MIRVFPFDLEGFGEIKLASMSTFDAENYALEGQEMVAKKDSLSPDDWFQRMIRVIEKSLTDGGGSVTLIDLKKNFDLPTLYPKLAEIHEKILEFSGLRIPKEGEAKTA